MNGFSGIFLIINFKSFLISLLAAFSTFVCITYKWLAEFPLQLVLVAVVFPIVFSIDAAYKRRELALDHYGDIKAHMKAIYLAFRDWPESPNEGEIDQCRDLMRRLFMAFRTMFVQPVAALRGNEIAVYESFSDLSRFIREHLRHRGVNTGEISRCNQYLSKIMISFEKIKHIYQYRTPRTLNVFRRVFIMVLPIAYGPYFAALAQDFSPGMAYITPVLVSVVLASLDNIQTHLENPFDGDSEDDLNINVEHLLDRFR